MKSRQITEMFLLSGLIQSRIQKNKLEFQEINESPTGEIILYDGYQMMSVNGDNAVYTQQLHSHQEAIAEHIRDTYNTSTGPSGRRVRVLTGPSRLELSFDLAKISAKDVSQYITSADVFIHAR